MASSQEYLDYVRAQADGPWTLRTRKMFGDWMVYADDRPILLVCDNTVFIKCLPVVEPLMQGAQRGIPYGGAREHWILDIDDVELTRAAIAALLPVTPLPKKRSRKKEVLP